MMVTDENLCALLRRCGELRELDLSLPSRSFSASAFDTVAQYCPKLWSLEASDIHVTQQTFRRLIKRLPHLKWFTLKRTLGKSWSVDAPKWMSKFQLKMIFPMGYQYLNEEGKYKFMEHCETLLETECRTTTPVGVDVETDLYKASVIWMTGLDDEIKFVIPKWMPISL